MRPFLRLTPPALLAVGLLAACDEEAVDDTGPEGHTWDPSSTLCGTIENADTGCAGSPLPETVGVWTVLAGSSACLTDTAGWDWVDELVAQPEVDEDGFFEAVVDPGDYGVAAYSDACEDCRPVTVDGEGCTEVALVLRPVIHADAPNVYLYPEAPAVVRVSVASPRTLTASDPPYGRGWEVLASPDGRLSGAFGERDFLFYERMLAGAEIQREAGFCVAGALALPAMEAVLEEAGFLPGEIADFSAFWDVEFPSAPTVTVYPQVDLPALAIVPLPDHLLRLWFAVRPGCHPAVEPQIPRVPREGFHAAEWGVAILPPLERADVVVTGL